MIRFVHSTCMCGRAHIDCIYSVCSCCVYHFGKIWRFCNEVLLYGAALLVKAPVNGTTIRQLLCVHECASSQDAWRHMWRADASGFTCAGLLNARRGKCCPACVSCRQEFWAGERDHNTRSYRPPGRPYRLHSGTAGMPSAARWQPDHMWVSCTALGCRTNERTAELTNCTYTTSQQAGADRNALSSSGHAHFRLPAR